MKFRIETYPELPSTNAAVLERAQQGEPEGLVIVADYQTQGYGKLNREWVSPPGKNLLFSILLRPPLSPKKAPMVTQLSCRAVAKVLKHDYRIETEFKRPNDILVQGKKICGILVESSSMVSAIRVDFMVVGIGLNVNALGDELYAGSASMRSITGKNYQRKSLLRKILDEFSASVVIQSSLGMTQVH